MILEDEAHELYMFETFTCPWRMEAMVIYHAV